MLSSKANQEEITRLFEEQISAMAKATSMERVIIALHNTCVHGEIFEETGEEIDDDQLEELFDRFHDILSIFRR